MEELKLNTGSERIIHFKSRIQKVLFDNIIPFWLKYSRDEEKGGFWGRVSIEGIPLRNAPKGLILNARILWTFAVLYKKFHEAEFLNMADRAYEYLMEYFWDKKYGGMFWLVDADGTLLDDKKKMYGQAFTIYALSEYFQITYDRSVLQKAIELFELMLQHNLDQQYGGFLETSTRDWQLAQDMRLSNKDLNAEKSMNTHLHILEAFTSFYSVWPESILRDQLKFVVQHFCHSIFKKQTGHLQLFFSKNWQVKSRAVSFGHDIEASWLLLDALDVLQDGELIQEVRDISLTLVQRTLDEGLSSNYAIYKERTNDGQLVPILEMWQEAEAAVGFAKAFLQTRYNRFYEAMLKTWDFLETYVVDWQNGEWFYEVDNKGRPNLNTYKISEWKGPYHNTRACLELMDCIEKMRGD